MTIEELQASAEMAAQLGGELDVPAVGLDHLDAALDGGLHGLALGTGYLGGYRTGYRGGYRLLDLLAVPHVCGQLGPDAGLDLPGHVPGPLVLLGPLGDRLVGHAGLGGDGADRELVGAVLALDPIPVDRLLARRDDLRLIHALPPTARSAMGADIQGLSDGSPCGLRGAGRT